MTHFKDEHWHTKEEALRAIRRLHRITAPAGYTSALFGSTLLTGQGHDIDVQIMGAAAQNISPAQLALRIIKKHAKEIHLYRQEDGEEMSDVWLCFVTHDKLYLDVHIKGVK